jgi:alpha-beta hydrolase superfamily lysophospholipase/SAM-dependent methyltransferase
MRVAVERTFVTHDGAELFFRHWPAVAPAEGPPTAVLLLHRGHEHGGRLGHLPDELDLPHVAFYAWDARGHGRSPGERGAAPGFQALVRDLEAWVVHLEAADGVARGEVALVAQSVGAVVAAAWVHDHAPAIRALVLASPAFSVQLYVPFARPGLQLLRAALGPFTVKSYVKSALLTHDRERARSYDSDPLVTLPISVDLLLALADAGDRVVADASAITVPTQLLISGDDWVVRHGPQHEFFVRLGSPTKERHLFPGLLHDTLGEADRAPVLAQVRRFLVERFAAPLEVPSRTDDHRTGYTRAEAEALATPLPLASWRGLYWAVTRAGLALGRSLSAGLEIGGRTGFDSGEMLDYVYHDTAEGLGPVGRLIDRVYLDSLGWRGIRRRKVHLEELIGRAVAHLRAEGHPVRILDVAAGHGRYVLDAVAALPERPDHVRLRDFLATNVRAGHAAVRARGLEGTAVFEQGDAFDADAVAAVDPAPTLGVVSGLYELFADNDLVARSLDGLSRAVAPGGWLIYTCQPWHPQLELIARALTSHREGRAWVMRRRTQGEMDQLVARAGFRKVEQRTDEWGMFTVCLAQKSPSNELDG